jgi:hypothetical protein
LALIKNKKAFIKRAFIDLEKKQWQRNKVKSVERPRLRGVLDSKPHLLQRVLLPVLWTTRFQTRLY